MTAPPDRAAGAGMTAPPDPAAGTRPAAPPDPAAGADPTAPSDPRAGAGGAGSGDIPPGTCLGPIDDIPPGEGRAYAVRGEAIAVFRLRDGSVRALPAVCPHRGGPLADGQIDLRQVVCPLHLNAWDLTTGRSLSGQPDLTTYPVRLDGDRIVLGE